MDGLPIARERSERGGARQLPPGVHCITQHAGGHDRGPHPSAAPSDPTSPDRGAGRETAQFQCDLGQAQASKTATSLWPIITHTTRAGAVMIPAVSSTRHCPDSSSLPRYACLRNNTQPSWLRQKSKNKTRKHRAVCGGIWRNRRLQVVVNRKRDGDRAICCPPYRGGLSAESAPSAAHKAGAEVGIATGTATVLAASKPRRRASKLLKAPMNCTRLSSSWAQKR